jgi:RNA exonuclease 1
MGRRGKRDYYEYRSGSRSTNPSMGDALHRVKKARLSSDDVSSENVNIASANDSTNDSTGEWQTVVSKSQKRKNNTGRGRRFDQTVDGPQLSFHDRVADGTSDLYIRELRDLALYVLADGVAPTFVAVKRSKEIKKVVVMMLPGLDEDMIETARRLFPVIVEQQSNGGNSSKDEDLRAQPESINQKDDIREEVTNGNVESTSLVQETNPISKQDSQWLFDNRLQVKAPGDPKWSKVHSPLQAMLIDNGPDRKYNNQPSDQVFHAVRTPITHFIHSADELRDAEYPIHPAAFTSQADGALEKSRRVSVHQASADGWYDSNVTTSSPVIPAASKATPRDQITQSLTVYSMDCEMVLTSDEKSSLARISLVSWPDGKVVVDKYVKPDLEINNYFTQYSGITPQILENVTTTLADIQAELMTLFTQSTILLGHSLESDLNALKMTHPFIVDTSMIYPHPRGLPLRSSLKFLANKYLKREIQNGGANGHNSVEDARAVLDLVKLKCAKGPKWGTSEASGVSVFKSISKHHRSDGRGRTSAIVEYGTPERGFGKDATIAIGCQNDDEILAGVLKASLGDSTLDSIPIDGVDFVWGRLRALEFARGWVSNNITPMNSDPSARTPDDTTPSAEIDTILIKTLHQIQHLRTALAASKDPTLLILYSGISDMRPVLHYQAMQNQYRKEFKVKKWNELSVRWTDVEEQALRRAVENARKGWGWVGVL